MIISRLHKYMFVAIPKTGTHAVRRALREHMGSQDMEQVGLFVQRQLPVPELAKLGHGHLSLQQIRPYMSDADFAAYFKFAFVRSPFDRFVSYCAFMTRDQGTFLNDPKAVMRQFLFDVPPEEHLLFLPQSSFVVDDAGRLLTDYVGRVEQMQQSYDEICERIGIPTAELDKVNSSPREGSYRDYYDQALIDGVAARYAQDIALFGYDF